MKKLFVIAISLCAMCGLAVTLSAAHDIVRAAPNKPAGWKTADFDNGEWSIPLADKQTQSFTVTSPNIHAKYMSVDMVVTNAIVVTDDGVEVCNQLGGAGTCENIIIGGNKAHLTVIANSDGFGSGYYITGAYYKK